MEVPPLRVWIRYLFNIPMDMADSFKFRYAEDKENAEKESSNDVIDAIHP